MTKRTKAKKLPKETREEWLRRAVAQLSPLLKPHTNGKPIPPMHVSVGFPLGVRSGKKTAVGQAHAPVMSADGITQIFISPVEADGVEVLSTLLHEMIHGVDENKSGHKGEFARMAKAVGFVGKMTETPMGDELKKTLKQMVRELGKYPHAQLSTSTRKKQGTRMIKAQCPTTEFTVRMSRKWIDELGSPFCPCCKERMEVPLEIYQ